MIGLEVLLINEQEREEVEEGRHPKTSLMFLK
jgi:hypothetical protein